MQIIEINLKVTSVLVYEERPRELKLLKYLATHQIGKAKVFYCKVHARGNVEIFKLSKYLRKISSIGIKNNVFLIYNIKFYYK